MKVTVANYNDQRRCVYNLLCSIPEKAQEDYLRTKLTLYKLLAGDIKLLKSIKRLGKTVEQFQDEKIAELEDARDLFMRGDLKALYGDKSGKEVIAALDQRFENEVIPTYEKTGDWNYKQIFIQQD